MNEVAIKESLLQEYNDNEKEYDRSKHIKILTSLLDCIKEHKKKAISYRNNNVGFVEINRWSSCVEDLKMKYIKYSEEWENI